MPYLQEKMPKAKGITVSNMKPPESGFASETFMFNLDYEEAGKQQSRNMVFRRPPLLAVFPDYDLRRQFLVMQRLQGTNVPVPKVFWRVEQDESILGTPFYIMERLPGTTPPDFPLYHSAGSYHDASPQKRAKMWWGSLEGIAKCHKVDWKKQRLDFLGAPKGGTTTIDGLLDYNESFLKWVAKGEPQPVLEYALKWLRENHYVPERITFCWGDCRMPNTLYNPDGDVVALLDWEFAYLGDPISDLAWFLFLDWHSSEAYGIPKLEGTPSEEETIRRYEELTGWKVKNLLYNQVLAPLRLGVPLVRLYKNLRSMGVTMLAEDAELNNPMTQRIASLLNLPAPGKKKEVTKVEDMKVTLQIHFTGAGQPQVVCAVRPRPDNYPRRPGRESGEYADAVGRRFRGYPARRTGPDGCHLDGQDQDRGRYHAVGRSSGASGDQTRGKEVTDRLAMPGESSEWTCPRAG